MSALILVTIGADVYQHTVTDMQHNYETRTSISYITEKIRQNDTSLTDGESSVGISSLSGQKALALTSELAGEEYCTYLYLYDGCLKELLIKKGSSLGGDALSAGQTIMELSDFRIEPVAKRLLSLQLTTIDGEQHQVFVSTHSDIDLESSN